MKGDTKMASVQKFRATAVLHELRHNHREIKQSSNPDINSEQSVYNDDLTPNHNGLSPYEYYKKRLHELYIYDPRRKDINTAFGWIVTLPQEVTSLEAERTFFRAVSDFLTHRYGLENTVSITIHRDESGQPHLHYIGIPAVANNMQNVNHPQSEKLSCKEVINRNELRSFHRELQTYLDNCHVDAKVHTGITAGNNRTVQQLKRETTANLRAEVERLKEIEHKYNELLRQQSLQKQHNRWERTSNQEIERGRW
jgi:hypothetical protein